MCMQEKLEQLEEVIAELNDIGDSDEEIQVGDLCVARIEESTVEGEIPWYRVKILEIDDDMVSCFTGKQYQKYQGLRT